MPPRCCRATIPNPNIKVTFLRRRPLLFLKRPSFAKNEGRVFYQYEEAAEEVERMDYLEFIAWATSHIPDKGRVTVRHFGLFADTHQDDMRKLSKNSISS
jgi:hypothetical protein